MPTSKHTPSNSSSSSTGNGINSRFQSSNPFAALATPGRGSNDSTGSPSSSTGSQAIINSNKSKRPPMTPPSGQKHSSSAMQHSSPEHVRQASTGSSIFSSPSHSRVNSAQHYADDIHFTRIFDRISQLRTEGGSQGQQTPHRRDSVGSQSSQYSGNSPRRPSFSSGLRAPAVPHATNRSGPTSLVGIPEELAVQEMGFQHGQHDHGNSRIRVPSNPFAKHFDDVWAESYKLGKAAGGTPAGRSAPASPSMQQDYGWEVFINPYTQDLEHPGGTLDVEWTRQICTITLDCMQAVICVVCKRPPEWQKFTCDVPEPAKPAIMAFPDLHVRYEKLKEDAREALGGGVPLGYEGY